jgi:hypothetical protein
MEKKPAAVTTSNDGETNISWNNNRQKQHVTRNTIIDSPCADWWTLHRQPVPIPRPVVTPNNGQTSKQKRRQKTNQMGCSHFFVKKN